MTTEERLCDLERALSKSRITSRWLAAGVLVAAACAMLAFSAQPGGAAKEVRASRFVLEDASGLVRAELTSGKASGTVSLIVRDVNEKPRLTLDMLESGRSLPLRMIQQDDTGTRRAEFSLNNGGAILVLKDDNNIQRVLLAAFEKGLSFNLWGDNEKPRVYVKVESDGPKTVLYDKTGFPLDPNAGGIPEGVRRTPQATAPKPAPRH